jgi:acyl dehydratase
MTDPSPAVADDVPTSITATIGQVQYEAVGDFPVEMGYVWTGCASVENGNPLFWDAAVADELTGGPVAPPSMISVWFRPHHWAPNRTEGALPLQVHFDLKAALGLPEAVMTDNTIVFHAPVRPGDLLTTHQVLRSVSGPKTTKLGTGRIWVIDVEYHNAAGELVAVESYTGFGYRKAETSDDSTDAHSASPAAPTDLDPAFIGAEPGDPTRPTGTASRLAGEVHEGDVLPTLRQPVSATTVVLGALAARDWRPMHHDHAFAVHRNGTRDIFLNTPNLAHWFERYITDWTGPKGRLGHVRFRMAGSIFPGDVMAFDATVTEVSTDKSGCAWVGLDVKVTVDGETKTTCAARVALPVDADDNPWARTDDRWVP